MFKISYCDFCVETEEDHYKDICKNFVKVVTENFPEYRSKLKIHLLLHLPESMMDFGPTSAFNTERFVEHNYYKSVIYM